MLQCHIAISESNHTYLTSLKLCSLLNVQSSSYFEMRMMYNISVTWESIQFINIEHIFPRSNTNPTILLVSIAAYILILATNMSLIKFILSQSSKTFLDRMMVFDSILCICNVITIAYIMDEEYLKIGKDLNLCYFLPYFVYFINLCNRLLTIGIVWYRYIFVIKSHTVRTQHQRKMLGTIIFGTILVISFLMTVWSIFHREQSHNFLRKFFLNSFFYF